MHIFDGELLIDCFIFQYCRVDLFIDENYIANYPRKLKHLDLSLLDNGLQDNLYANSYAEQYQWGSAEN